MPLHDADGGEQAHGVGVDPVRGLVLHHLVQFLVEAEVVGADRVDLLARDVDEFGCRRVGRLGERENLRTGLDVLHGGCVVPLFHEGAIKSHHRVGARVLDVIALLGQGALVSGGNEQVVATGALVRPGQPDIGDPAEVGVIHRAQDPGGHTQHHRALGEVDTQHGVDRRGVGGQEQGAGIQQVLGDAYAPVELDARFLETFAQCMDRGGRDAASEGLDAAAEVQLVVGELHRRFVGRAVAEVQRADPRFDSVGCGDFRRHIGRKLRCGAGLGNSQQYGGRQGSEFMPSGVPEQDHSNLALALDPVVNESELASLAGVFLSCKAQLFSFGAQLQLLCDGRWLAARDPPR